MAAPPSPPLPLHFLGCGSIGLLFASYIRHALPRYPLTMLLREGHRNRVRHRRAEGGEGQEGYIVSEVSSPRNGGGVINPSISVDLPAEIIHRGSSTSPSIRSLILTTKAPDAASAVRSVVRRLHARGADVVVLTNGALAVRDEVRDVLDGAGRRTIVGTEDGDSVDDGAVRLILGSTTHGAHRGVDHGGGGGDDDHGNDDDYIYRVVHAGYGHTSVYQPLYSSLFNAAGLNARFAAPEEMSSLLWRKLAANCAINPLTALRRCTNGELLSSPEESERQGGRHAYDDDREVIDQLLREVANVAAAEALAANATSALPRSAEEISEGLGFHPLRSFVDEVIRDTSANRSSMLQDVLSGRHPTEIRYLNGYIARAGERHGIATPMNNDVVERVEGLMKSFAEGR